jgi:Tfp pilus assembly protein PilF
MNADLSMAINLFNSGNKIEAKALLEKIVKDDPQNSTAWYGLALCQNRLDQAINLLEKSVLLDPTNEKANQVLVKLRNQQFTSHQDKISGPNQSETQTSIVADSNTNKRVEKTEPDNNSKNANSAKKYAQIEMKIMETRKEIKELEKKLEKLNSNHAAIAFIFLLGMIFIFSGISFLVVMGITFVGLGIWALVLRPKAIKENEQLLSQSKKKLQLLLQEKANLKIND